jgi:multidrug resistance protein, MATE family
VAARRDGEEARVLGRLVWVVSLPLLFVGLSDTIIHVTDTAFLGRVGTTDLAAFALADTFFDVAVVPVIGLAEAMQILIARRLGQGHDGLVGPIFRRGMALILGVSTALAVGLFFAAASVSRVVAESPDVAVATERFLRVAALGVPFFSLSVGCSAFWVGIARTRVLLAAALVLGVVNFGASYALILGRFGLPRLGIEGAAWAFTIAEAATFAFLAVRTVKHLRERARNSPQVADDAPPAIFSPMMRLAPPVALEALVEGLRWLVFFVIVGHVGEEELAWSNLVFACYMVLVIPSDAIADGTHSLASNLVGQDRRREVPRLARRATRVGYLITAVPALVSALVPHQVLALFTDDLAAIDGAAPSLRVVAAAMLVVIPAEIWLAAVVGTGAADVGFGIEFILTSTLLVGTYLTTITFELSLTHTWASLAVASLVSIGLSRWWLARARARDV